MPNASAASAGSSRKPDRERARRRAGDFLTRAVVEGHDEIETGVVARQLLGLVEQRADVGIEARTLADHAHPHPVAVQRRKVVADETAQQTEQIADLACRPRPVFRAEREDREVDDAELMGCANDPAQRLDPAAMPLRARQPARCRPAPVAVHDDGDMQRTVGSIRLFGCGDGIRHRSIFIP